MVGIRLTQILPVIIFGLTMIIFHSIHYQCYYMLIIATLTFGQLEKDWPRDTWVLYIIKKPGINKINIYLIFLNDIYI
jgi:hypothetical protein